MKPILCCGEFMRNRLHSICPYFAMFPEQFVREHVEAYTQPGDYVFDPFSGRGTTAFQSLLLERKAISTDINPVAYCITSAKSEIPQLTDVINGIDLLEQEYLGFQVNLLEAERSSLPPFFSRAFEQAALDEILFLRKNLNWRTDKIHRFIAALALGSLHGEMDKSKSYFSNQMPRTISTKPAYSLRYWQAHNLWPPERHIFNILRQRAYYRLEGYLPQARGQARLGDARSAARLFPEMRSKVSAIITSPPYHNVTSYEEDQWLRLWFLGHEAHPTYRKISKDDRHDQQDKYWRFLSDVWEGVAPLAKHKCVLVCRIGAKDIRLADLVKALDNSVLSVFPNAFLLKSPVVSKIHNRQTDLFRPGSTGCLYEVDYVYRLN